jgi:protein required for attachment to host cells
MSDADWMDGVKDEMNEADGLFNAMGHIGAIKQRGMMMAQQQRLADQAKKSAAVEKDRLKLEQKRFEAEEAEREMRRIQEQQIKELRNFMADSISELQALKKSVQA